MSVDQKIKAKNKRLLNLYGITYKTYVKMLEKQSHKCAICENPPKTKSLNVDHLHKKDSKKKQIKGDKSLVRGLLCFFCNKYVMGAIERRTSVPARFLIEKLNMYAKMYELQGDKK